ncbi:MAG: zinc ribbon domain-containing protein [Phycisphaerae bacterium]
MPLAEVTTETALARFPLGAVFVAIFITLIVILASSPKAGPRDCPRCGEANSDRANYCAHCGRNLQQP